MCRYNPASPSGYRQFLLRLNDEDACWRIRPGHIGIGLGICIALGSKTQPHKLQSLSRSGRQRRRMLTYPVCKGHCIHAPERCCWCADVRCAQASANAEVWNKRRYFTSVGTCEEEDWMLWSTTAPASNAPVRGSAGIVTDIWP